MPYRILIGEDDRDIVELLSLYLKNEGFEVFTAYNGVETLDLFQQNQIDLLLCDIKMPLMNGYEVIKTIRQTSNLPIIIISSNTLDRDKILGLGIGADVYLTKPFNPLEVIANIKAVLRRFYDFNIHQPLNNQHLIVGDLDFDMDAFELKKAGELIPLTATEMRIMMKLMQSPGRVFTKAQLFEAISNRYLDGDDDTLMVHISRIRAKVEEDPSRPRYIKTIRGLGYKINET